jgi:hypothetical protein
MDEANIDARRQLEEEVKQLRVTEQDLNDQNRDLKRALDDQEDREAQHAREADYLDNLRRQVEQAVPDLAVLEQRVAERNNMEREERDRKVLRILKAKDQRIGELQGENAGLLRVIEQQRLQMDALQAAWDETQKHMDELIGAREDAMRQLHVEVSNERDKCIQVREYVDRAGVCVMWFSIPCLP